VVRIAAPDSPVRKFRAGFFFAGSALLGLFNHDGKLARPIYGASVILLTAACFAAASAAHAQVPPSPAEVQAYEGLLESVYAGDLETTGRLIASGVPLETRDGRGRTAVHLAAFTSDEAMLELLAAAGAQLDQLEFQHYDIVTIAAVANDPEFLARALQLGASPSNTTSIYEGTALIAAAHLGHFEVVRILVEAGAPLDHVNNLGWTALIEAVVLGDGGPDHQRTARVLLDAGADRTIADRQGRTPLQLAKQRGYTAMVELLD